MKLSDIMSSAGLVAWAEAGLVLFFLCFVVLGLWLFLTRNSPHWEEVRYLPFNDDVARTPSPRPGLLAAPPADAELAAAELAAVRAGGTGAASDALGLERGGTP